MSAFVLQPVELFTPAPTLVPGHAQATCRACVTVPVRNEELRLAACLDALAAQQDLQGRVLPQGCFEVLVLLNNCTDNSAAVARRWGKAHPRIELHLAERWFSPAEAHVGTARRLLMDTAWQRLEGKRAELCAILSTDADSTVAPDWIAHSLLALERGADAVGGSIAMRESDLATLPAQVRLCYERDRRYAELIAELEDLLDPQPGDHCPRHLDHFGSSLACTRQAYAAAGGMPAVSPLEDEAFVKRLREANLCLRHEPAVRVFTSARLHGRAAIGLAGQLRQWDGLAGETAHYVQSAAFLVHRFETLRLLREIFHTGQQRRALRITDEYQRWVRTARCVARNIPDFLTAIDSDSLIEQSFPGEREQPITAALQELEAINAKLAAGGVSREVVT